MRSDPEALPGGSEPGLFELPETLTLTRQMCESVEGLTVARGRLGSSPHKFVWYNRTHDEFEALTAGMRAGAAHARGRWMFLPLGTRLMLVFGECGGRLLFHPEGTRPPAKHHLLLEFEDGSSLSMTTQMWGAMELFEDGAENGRQYIRDMRPTPVEPGFTPGYLADLVEEQIAAGKRPVKGLLTQDQLIPGLGNSIAQDIMFRAGLHPRRPIDTLSRTDIEKLHEAITGAVEEAASLGGRDDETDLHGRPGGYARIMNRAAAGGPCPSCGSMVQKMQFLGGACFFCPSCQI
jgi:formamidopyrimidine-DNA glycosylase